MVGVVPYQGPGSLVLLPLNSPLRRSFNKGVRNNNFLCADNQKHDAVLKTIKSRVTHVSRSTNDFKQMSVTSKTNAVNEGNK